MRRSEISTKQPAVDPALQVASLVAELHRFVAAMEADIQAEEERSNVFDCSSTTYPVLAQHLRVRRDNLLATIALLETQQPALAA
jgi:hypothetical protein